VSIAEVMSLRQDYDDEGMYQKKKVTRNKNGNRKSSALTLAIEQELTMPE
jgi:hypothetical protein